MLKYNRGYWSWWICIFKLREPRNSCFSLFWFFKLDLDLTSKYELFYPKGRLKNALESKKKKKPSRLPKRALSGSDFDPCSFLHPSSFCQNICYAHPLLHLDSTSPGALKMTCFLSSERMKLSDNTLLSDCPPVLRSQLNRINLLTLKCPSPQLLPPSVLPFLIYASHLTRPYSSDECLSRWKLSQATFAVFMLALKNSSKHLFY